MTKILITLLSFLITTTGSGQKFLFIGDSLTCYKGGWQDQVSKTFKAESTNISKGGKRTSWMLPTLVTQLGQNKNYTKVFIYGGCNDAYSFVPLDMTVKNIQSMVDLCNLNKIEPVVILGYDPKLVMKKTPYSESVTNFHRGRYITLQKMLKEQLTNCTIVDVCPTVDYSDTGDGIHLKGLGHKKFSDWVLEKLSNIY